jgi:hypothetical protein
VALAGKNLPTESTLVDVSRDAPCVVPVSVTREGLVAPPVPFAIGQLPEVLENEGASSQKTGQRVECPVVINGRIRVPGECDVYRINGKKGDEIRMEVHARRLGSPLDSLLTLLDRRGEKLGSNDDVKDPSEGLLTHQADSELQCKLPEDGAYVVQLSDTQGKGGDDYSYRLTLAPPAPDFELRALPSSLSLGAGSSVPFTVQALRRCGFTGDIQLAVDPASAPGCSLEGGVIWSGSDKARVTLFVPDRIGTNTFSPRFYGAATIGGARVTRPVIPAEDRMQAFIYRHLVPSAECTVSVPKPAPFRVETIMGPSGYLALPLGKETTFSLKVTRRPGFNEPIRFQLEDPPKGITLRRGNIPPGRDVGFATIRVESKVEEALKGNLILTGIMMLDPPSKEGGSNGMPSPASGPGTAKQAVIAPSAVAAKTTAANPGGKGAVPPGGAGGFVVRERVGVSLPALPFRVVENPEKRKSDASAPVKK